MRANEEVRRRCHSCTRMATSTRTRCDDAWGHAHLVSNADGDCAEVHGGIKAGAAAQQQASTLSDEWSMQKEQEMEGGGGVVETYNEGKQGHTVRIGEDDARQDLLHVNSRAVSKQPYIIEIMNQREQARWRTAGGRFAAGFLRTACARVASPCGSGHGSLLATKCNKSDNSTWQMPAQKIMENHRWEGRHSLDFSQTSTACGQLPASGDAT